MNQNELHQQFHLTSAYLMITVEEERQIYIRCNRETCEFIMFYIRTIV